MLPYIVLFAFLKLIIPMNVLSSEENSFLNKFGEPILKYISKEVAPQYQTNEYKTFFNKMTENDFYSTYAIILGYQVTQLQKLYPKNPDLEHILQRFPPEIINIPWEVPVYIYNIATNHFLCAGDEKLLENSAYYKTNNSIDRNANCVWNFSVGMNGEHFTIQNNANKQYLVVVLNPFDTDEPQPTICTVEHTTNITETSDLWQLKPYRTSDDNPVVYQIKDFLWDQYTCVQHESEDYPTENHDFDTSLCLWRIMTKSMPLSSERKKVLSGVYAQYTGDDKTAKIILQHANSSTTRIAEYTNLFDLMTKHDGFYTVAGMILDYNVEQLRKQYPNDIGLFEIENYFRNLWTPFPWNRPVTIQNKGDLNFVCVPDMNKGEPRMQATNETCFWKFEIDANGFDVNIKTLLHDRYLTAESKGMVFWGKRTVAVVRKAPKKDIDRWQLVHERISYHEVMIRNVHFNETFYSLSDAKIPRPATKSGVKNDCVHCKWIIHEANLTSA